MAAAPRILVRLGTRQHDALLEGALSNLELAVDEDLGIMRPNQDLYDVSLECLGRPRPLVRSLKPDVVVVEGDTATVFFGALVGFYERAQVAHIEAGLRSRQKWAPFPEETFRRLTDVLADHYFAPTPGAKRNLVAEGVSEDRVNVTGNTVIDAVQRLARPDLPVADLALRELFASGHPLVLVTAHRRESFGAPIREAFGALRTLAEEHPEHTFVYPVHPNPNVLNPAHELLSGLSNFRLLDPLSYSDLIHVLARACLVFTDSGGIQEEAPSFGVPVLVLREVTERPEGVEAGVVALVGTSRERILGRGRALLNDPEAHREMAHARNPYGDGRAGERIADILIQRLHGTPRKTEDWH